jgi:hypothetical protein
LADQADKYRAWYITQNIEAVQEAALEGVDVRGYLHWSLLDNFELTDGYQYKFGLMAVDFSSPDLTRTVRPSAMAYQQIIQSKENPSRTVEGCSEAVDHLRQCCPAWDSYVSCTYFINAVPSPDLTASQSRCVRAKSCGEIEQAIASGRRLCDYLPTTRRCR